MSEWRTVNLSECIRTNTKSIDSSYKYETIVYLDTGSITCNKIDSLQEILIADAPSRARRLVKDQNVIYSSVRPNQLHYGFIINPIPNLVVSTGFVVIESIKEKIIPKFLYYFLTQSETTEYLHSIAEASTSAYPSLKPSDIEALEITLPPLPEQRDIASVLSSLDDKIDLLHRQNKTLEAMAETLFRQWFVEEADAGWEEETISQLISVQNGYAFKSKDFQVSGENSVIKIKNISGGIIDIGNTDFIDAEIALKTASQFKIDSGDILIAMTGAEIGKLGIIPDTNKNLWLNQRVGLLREKYFGSKYLAYLQLKSDYGQDYINNTATGSAQPNISGIGIENCGFPKISENMIRKCSLQIGELYTKVIFNLGQIRNLEKHRDTLLPKLMSGEVRVHA